MSLEVQKDKGDSNITESSAQILKQQHPEVTLLDAKDLSALSAYLHAQHWLGAEETLVAATKAGEGNMNYTLRITATQAKSSSLKRTLILKQARPWVEKYPQIAAPWGRILQEATFYKMTAEHPAVAQAMPELLGIDTLSRVVAFEDLGEAADFSSLYREDRSLNPAQLTALIQWLSTLHGLSWNASQKQMLRNREMRALNHEHIFALPFRSDDSKGLDLDTITPGLEALADELRTEVTLVETIAALGRDYYLQDGPVLLHGDFFPGSWLDTPQGVRIIDPEFAFFGPAEFDAGVFLAHLILAQQSPALIEDFFKTYVAERPVTFSCHVMIQLAGIEILRRLIGIAQLPLSASISQKCAWISIARMMILKPQEYTKGVPS